MEQVAPIEKIPNLADWRNLLAWIDRSFDRNPNRWLYSLLLAGLAIRMWYGWGTYLNPDEALHFSVANQTTWWLTYKRSLILGHPPLLIFLLHAWRTVATSEWMLRLPSIVAGTAACWLAYRWLALLTDLSVAVTAYGLMLFLPSSIELSAEVRQYALLLAFSMAAGYLAELGLARNSVPAMLGSGLCLCLALATHYSAFLFALTLGVYTALRMRQQHSGLKVFAAWEFGQVLAVGLGYFFFVTHLTQLGKTYGGVSAVRGFMANEFLGNSYYAPGRVNPLLFVFARTGGVLQYLFEQPVVGDLAYPVFVLGLIQLLRRRERPGRLLGLLLVFPFLANALAALVRAYPYGGTRHCFLLLPFASALVATGLVSMLRKQLARGVLVALAVALLCNLIAARRAPYISRPNQRQKNMVSAIAFLRQVGPASPIFTDDQTSHMLGYYFCDQRPLELNQTVLGFTSFECGGHQVIVAHQFVFSARSFSDPWQEMIKRYRLPPGTRVQVTQMGWSVHVARDLAGFPELHLNPHYFGGNLQIFELTAGEKLPDPELLPGS
jgi:hypothetical protein